MTPWEPCPLCAAIDATLLHNGGKGSGFRHFLHCGECDMVFVPRAQIIDSASQKARYLQHNNEVDDPAYREFLGRMYYALRPHLNTGDCGLDYGSGPGPALQHMILEDGFDAHAYDIFFYPDTAVLNRSYDFITCTETVEHFTDPRTELQRFDVLLRPGGWLGVMTGMLDSWDDFPSWYYHRDPTHVNFFSRETMSWVAAWQGWDAHYPRENVVLFKKPE